jgi:hypothetical protein
VWLFCVTLDRLDLGSWKCNWMLVLLDEGRVPAYETFPLYSPSLS